MKHSIKETCYCGSVLEYSEEADKGTICTKLEDRQRLFQEAHKACREKFAISPIPTYYHRPFFEHGLPTVDPTVTTCKLTQDQSKSVSQACDYDTKLNKIVLGSEPGIIKEQKEIRLGPQPGITNEGDIRLGEYQTKPGFKG